MEKYAVVAQVVIAVSIVIVWVGRFDNIVREFREYRLPDAVRNVVGATKISLATLLVAGIWYPSLVLVPALIMAFLMLGAQWAHFSVRHPWPKYVPSLCLLLLSLFVAGVHAGVIASR
jgi:hypothetical protein